MPNPIIFEIKKFKSFIGNEGHGFNADLYMDGKKVCFVIDDASGGEIQFQWNNRDFEKQFDEYVDALPIEKIEDDADAWEKEIYPNGRKWSSDLFMSALVDRHQTFASMSRKTKKSTVFATPKNKKGEYYSINLPFSPETKAKILANPKNAGAQFLNEHLEDGKWVEILKMRILPVPVPVPVPV